MSLEDAHVLGLCLGRLKSKSRSEKKRALEVYENCRRARTERVVQRGNLQQHLYHIHDGEEQIERDRLFKAFGEFNGKGLVKEEEYKAAGLQPEADPLPWRWSGVGRWLLTYDCEKDVERRWKETETSRSTGQQARSAKADKQTSGVRAQL
jgi:salicylate hydroxylase